MFFVNSANIILILDGVINYVVVPDVRYSHSRKGKFQNCSLLFENINICNRHEQKTTEKVDFDIFVCMELFKGL